MTEPTYFYLYNINIFTNDLAAAAPNLQNFIKALVQNSGKDSPTTRDKINNTVAMLTNPFTESLLPVLSQTAEEQGLELLWSVDSNDLTIHNKLANVQIPKTSGPFERAKMEFFARGWYDTVFNYAKRDRESRHRISLYVSHYPNETAEIHMEKAKTAILVAYGKNAPPFSEVQETSPPGHPALHGLSTTTKIHLKGKMLFASELYIFTFKGWHIKVRSSYPEDQAAKGHEDTLAFLSGFPWPSAQ